MDIEITAQDFEQLFENSGQWSSAAPGIDLSRFEHTETDPHDPAPRLDWKYAYWFGDNWAPIILARAFLRARGEDAEILWDSARHPNGQYLGYIILTNYASLCWQKTRT